MAEAEAHLKKAIDGYKKVVELKSDHYLARLGLAWCLEQAGEKEEAITRHLGPTDVRQGHLLANLGERL